MIAPWLSSLVAEVATADDPRAASGALAVIRAKGCTPDPVALDAAVTAARDGARFREHLGDWSKPGVVASPFVDVWQAAADECDRALHEALLQLARPAVVAGAA